MRPILPRMQHFLLLIPLLVAMGSRHYFTYDAASRISGITYPSGWIAKYARNAEGEVTGVTAAPNSTATPSSIVGSIAYLGLGEADTSWYSKTMD